MKAKVNRLLPDSQKEEEERLEQEKLEAGRHLEKTKEKPYHIKNRGLYYLACFALVVCPLVSIITESSLVFAKCRQLMENLPRYKNEASVVLTIILIGSLEMWQIFTASGFYEKYVARNGTTGLIYPMITLLSIGFLLTSLSYFGNFDLLRIVSNPPTLKTFVATTKADIEAIHNPIIEEAKIQKDQYFERNKYKGRLELERSRRQEELNTEYKAALAARKTALSNLRISNREQERDINLRNEDAKRKFDQKITIRGSWLFLATFACICFMHLAMWYTKLYKKRKTDYFKKIFPNAIEEVEYQLVGSQLVKKQDGPTLTPAEQALQMVAIQLNKQNELSAKQIQLLSNSKTSKKDKQKTHKRPVVQGFQKPKQEAAKQPTPLPVNKAAQEPKQDVKQAVQPKEAPQTPAHKPVHKRPTQRARTKIINRTKQILTPGTLRSHYKQALRRSKKKDATATPLANMEKLKAQMLEQHFKPGQPFQTEKGIWDVDFFCLTCEGKQVLGKCECINLP